MLRPLAIGLPIILMIVAAFVAAMIFVPFESPYFTYVIVGYVVLFPLALIATIFATIRSVKRVVGGGDASLMQSGRRATASVLSVKGGVMTVRVSGSPRYRVLKVRLKVEDPGAPAYETSVRRAITMWDAAPAIGQRLTVFIDRLDRDNLYVVWADSAIVAGATQPGINTVALTLGGKPVDLSQLSAEMAQLVRMGLSMAGRQIANGESANGQPTVINLTPDMLNAAGGTTPAPSSYGSVTPQPQPLASPIVGSETIGAGALDGRARIENFRPYPDGTYDLDLYVTPRTKASYRVALRTAIPQAQIDRLAKGLTLPARIDPDLPSRVELVWGSLA